MSIRTDWQVSGTRRNFHPGACTASGALPLARRSNPCRAWQRDVSRGLPRLQENRRVVPGEAVKGRDEDPVTSPLPGSVRRLKALARSLVSGLPATGRRLADASS